MAGEQKSVRQSAVLCCGGRRRCPEISETTDGSFVLHDEDQADPGMVVLTREQARALHAELGRMLAPVQAPGFEGDVERTAVDRAFRNGMV